MSADTGTAGVATDAAAMAVVGVGSGDYDEKLRMALPEACRERLMKTL